MARKISLVMLITSLLLIVGCQGSGPAMELAPRSGSSIGGSSIAVNDEISLVEDVTVSREAYRRGLQLLVRLYQNTGDNRKLGYAQTELSELDAIRQYNYVGAVFIMPPNTAASTIIPDADALFDEAQAYERQATPIGDLVTDKNKYRLALAKYDQLIKDYPTSDKIDDAAFQSGKIIEYFGDYDIALEYYKKAFEWDPDTPYPARFKAARILDKYMHQYSKALELYKEAIDREGIRYSQWKTQAEERVKELETP